MKSLVHGPYLVQMLEKAQYYASVFKATVGLVLNYGLFTPHYLSHYWMHAGQGGADHKEHSSLSGPSGQLSLASVENNVSQNRRQGCH